MQNQFQDSLLQPEPHAQNSFMTALVQDKVNQSSILNIIGNQHNQESLKSISQEELISQSISRSRETISQLNNPTLTTNLGGQQVQ